MDMKKGLFLLSALALALVSCKNEEGDGPEQQASNPVVTITAFFRTGMRFQLEGI